MNEAALNQDSVVCWSANAVATDVNGEVVLMHLERDRCYGLGETGSAIWRRLRHPVRVAEIFAALRQEYDAPEGTLEQDVLRTLMELTSEGLVEIVR